MSDGERSAYNWESHSQYNEPQPRQPKVGTHIKVSNAVGLPQKEPQSQHQPDQGEKTNDTEEVESSERKGTFTLSAEAKEFIPKALQNPQPITDTVYSSEFSASGPEFCVEGEDGVYHMYDPANLDYFLGNNFAELNLEDVYQDGDESYYTANYSHGSIDERFNLALEILTSNPGNVEEYLEPICNEIESTSMHDQIAPVIVESLYQQCIIEENFRYIGARICQYLNLSLKMEPNFVKRFVNRCKEDFNIKDQLVNGSLEDKNKIQGLGMLLAEIFLNVETSGPDGSTQRLAFLPSILIKIIDTLLSVPENANVKCGCQMLKLSGSVIENIVKDNLEDCLRFEGLFESLRKLLKCSKISDNTKFIMEKLLKLKDNDWDDALPQGIGQAYNPYAQKEFYQTETSNKDTDESGAIFLTEEEENDFFEWQFGIKFDMEEAYEEFLKQEAPSSNYNYQMPAAPTPNSAAPTPDQYHYQTMSSQMSNYPSHENHYPQQHQYPQLGQHHQQQQQYAQYNQQQQQPQQHHRDPSQNPRQNDQYHFRK